MALPTPVAYWPFNEGTGTTSVDASGNGHLATLGVGTWATTLRIFGASALTAVDGGRSATFAPINLGTVHSVAFWVNGWDGSNDGALVGGTGLYACYISSADFFYSDGVSAVSRPHGGLAGARHVVITRNGSTVSWYKDGALVTSATMASNAPLILTTLGGLTDGTNGFAGTLDDIRCYDVALAPAQITELYGLDPDPRGTRVKVQTSPVGSASGGSTTAVSVTFGTMPVVGDAVVVVVDRATSSGTTGCTDTFGHTYGLVLSRFHSLLNHTVDVYLCGAITATGTPFTVTATAPVSSAELFAIAVEVSGGLALNQTATSGGSGTVAASGTTAALTGTADYFEIAAVDTTSTFYQQSPGWVDEATYLIGAFRLEVNSRSIAASAGSGATQSLTWALSGANSWIGVIAAFHGIGPTSVTVPDVKGKSQAQAVADLIAAGLVPGQVTKEKHDKVPPGHVIRQDPAPPTTVPPGTPVNLVISGGAGGGVGPIGMLPGKVNAANALQVTATVPTMRTAALAGSTALTDAVLIPAPPPAQRIIVRRLTVSTLAAGPFSVRFAAGGTPILGPVWLTSGQAGVTTGRLFGSGPIAFALPAGQGLTVTTSAAAPQTIEADYDLVGA